MKIVLIGVTGRVGVRIARELTARGHQVTGLNRRPERVKARLGDLDIETLACDIADTDRVRECVAGADAVILAALPTREHPEDFPKNNANVIAACKLAGVPRLIAVTNHMALKAPNGMEMLEFVPPHPYFYNIEASYPAQRDVYLAEKELDWVLIASPYELVPYLGATGKFRTGGDTLLVTGTGSLSDTSRLSMEDFAYFIADETEQHRHSRCIVTAAY